jgi:hypothetical protein
MYPASAGVPSAVGLGNAVDSVSGVVYVGAVVGVCAYQGGATMKRLASVLIPLAGVLVPLLLILVVALSDAGSLWYAENARGEQKTQALLSGDANVHLERLRIEWGQRRVICTDPQVLGYLEARFRQYNPNPVVARDLCGSYEWTLSYQGGGRHAIMTTLYDGGILLDFDSDFPSRHEVSFPEPRPAAVDIVVKFLHRPYQEVKGIVLIVEPQGILQKYDDSLVAR